MVRTFRVWLLLWGLLPAVRGDAEELTRFEFNSVQMATQARLAFYAESESVAKLAADEVFAKWDKPFLTAFGDSDPVTAGGDVLWQELVPGASGQPHTTIVDGHHFIQEDKPEDLVRIMIDFIEAN